MRVHVPQTAPPTLIRHRHGLGEVEEPGEHGPSPAGGAEGEGERSQVAERASHERSQVRAKQRPPARRQDREGGPERLAIGLGQQVLRPTAVDREGVDLDTAVPQGPHLPLHERVRHRRITGHQVGESRTG